MGEDRQKKAQYWTILNTVPDMVYVLDPEFHFIFVNDAMADVTGYDRDELLGAHASLLFDDAAIEGGTWNRDQLRAGDIEFGYTETELKTAHDDRIPCEIRCQLLPEFDDTDLGAGTAGVIRDVSERKARERELQAQSTAIEASIDGMAILDTDEEYAFVNQAHADIYGYDTPDAFLGETWQMCYTEEEATRFEEDVMPTLFEENSWRGQAVGICKDGSTFPQELSLSLTDDGRIICVVRDITELKERQRELQRKNERLDEFASVVSHDLRNPLNIAQGRLELAQQECESEHLDAAANGIDRSQTLLEDLLTLAREGSRIGEVTAVDLAAVTEECWRTVETKEATLVVETEQHIRADRSRLRELLENLIRNAVEHGGEDITVRVAERDNGFYVADDGPGIPDGERDQVFEAGYSTATDGTGFGLNIVREIADAHGWNVQVTASEGGGAHFDFTGVTTTSADR
ncbi:PAS domain-containing sensor histidine kinase [Salinibaculum marinum]|uniref:PAS domain-containing sensor histidine kinase n=1 Tax=Salinibaculum marinum TaxID=3131993 RepID=UPI0030D4596C